MSLTKADLLKPRRLTEPLTLPELPEPLLMAAPSGHLALTLREMQKRGVEMNSREGLAAIIADTVADSDGVAMLTSEDVPAFIAGLSAKSLTALFEKFAEMYAGKKAEEDPEKEPVPSKPSTSA